MKKGNTLRTDPSDNQGNFNRQFNITFTFTLLTQPDAN